MFDVVSDIVAFTASMISLLLMFNYARKKDLYRLLSSGFILLAAVILWGNLG